MDIIVYTNEESEIMRVRSIVSLATDRQRYSILNETPTKDSGDIVLVCLTRELPAGRELALQLASHGYEVGITDKKK
jgi:hypothetical protein